MPWVLHHIHHMDGHLTKLASVDYLRGEDPEPVPVSSEEWS